MKQALVVRIWEDGSTDLWISRQRFETIDQARSSLNDKWNVVSRLVSVEDYILQARSIR